MDGRYQSVAWQCSSMFCCMLYAAESISSQCRCWLPTPPAAYISIWCCRGVVEKVQSLKQQLSDTQSELASLQQQYNLGEKRLVRASKLISALGEEAGRWGNSADALATRLQLLVGMLHAAAILYH